MAKNSKNHSTTFERGFEQKADLQLGVQTPKPKDINLEGITNSEVSPEKTEDSESKNENLELQETKDTNPEKNADPEVSPEKTEADQPEETKNYDSEAKELMDKNHIKQIWRCPITGYWFTSDVYAEEQKKRTGKSLEFYKL